MTDKTKHSHFKNRLGLRMGQVAQTWTLIYLLVNLQRCLLHIAVLLTSITHLMSAKSHLLHQVLNKMLPQ